MTGIKLIFVRAMLENMLDQGETERVMAMSREIDRLMVERMAAREEAGDAQERA